MTWMLSAEGTAVATWGSDILSVLAICLALFVFLKEQRRFHDEQFADERRKAEQLNRFVDNVIEVVDRMEGLTSDVITDLADGGSSRIAASIFGVQFQDYRREMQIGIDAIWIYRKKAPDDPDIAMGLARLQRTGEALRERLGNPGFMSPADLGKSLQPHLDALQSDSEQLRFEKIDLASLGKLRP